MTARCLAIGLSAALAGACGPSPEHAIPADVVVHWNDAVLDLAESEDGFLTLKGVRAAAIMHLAMHDGLAAIDRRSTPVHELVEVPNADPVVTANEAAYEVVRSQYPDAEARLAAERLRWLPADTLRPDVISARALGRKAASAALADRHDDGWNTEVGYTWHPMAPGVYAEFSEHSGTPQGFIFGTGWALARPFALERAGQFRPPPPPAITSAVYTTAFREVMEVGARESSTRSADQTHLAMWWKEFIERSHNRLARELVMEEGRGLWDAARLFALLNVAIFDGYVASFEGKYHYNHWRPYTAIRWADHDGNPGTRADTTWTNLHDHTYAFPSYPSAHGTVCGAASVVLADVFGADYSYSMTIPAVDSAGPLSRQVAMDPATRSFASFDEAATECGMSRVYLGIHFRYDSEAGVALGRQVGRWVVSRLLVPAADSHQVASPGARGSGPRHPAGP
jgi:hypothetical protein